MPRGGQNLGGRRSVLQRAGDEYSLEAPLEMRIPPAALVQLPPSCKGVGYAEGPWLGKD